MEGNVTPSRWKGSQFQVPEYILVDLCSRFIINIPEEERQDLIRIFFQIELAHWFYLDFYCQENADLKAIGIKDFSAQIFYHCPTLNSHAGNVDRILESWREYKFAVPTYGAILLDPNAQYCLLVQGFCAKAWGFPKGKVNEEEAPADCAIREVLEETGFDISELIDKEEYIEYKMSEQLSRLYIISGVSMDTKFMPRTRNEIKRLEWFRIEYLPTHKKDVVCRQHYNLPPNAFFMVIPFVKPLRKWIARSTGALDAGEYPYKQRPRRDSQHTDRPNSSSGSRQRRESSSLDGWASGATTPGGASGGGNDKAKQKQMQKQQFLQNTKKDYQELLDLRKPRGGGGGASSGGAQESRAKSDSPHVRAGGAVQGGGHHHVHPHTHARSKQASHSPRPSGGGNKKQGKQQDRQPDKPMQIMKRDGQQSRSTSGNTRRALATQFTSDDRASPRRKSRKDYPKQQSKKHGGTDVTEFLAPSWINFHLDRDAILNVMFP